MHRRQFPRFVQRATAPDSQVRARRLFVCTSEGGIGLRAAAVLGAAVALAGCTPSKDAEGARSVVDGGRAQDVGRAADAGACRPVGHYEAGKEGSYLPCCAGLREELQQVAGQRGDTQERVCDGPVGFRNYVCVEGRCGDGRCEAPESIACGCPADCPSAAWQSTDAGSGAPRGDASLQAEGGVPGDAGTASLVPTLASAQQSYLRWTPHSEQPQPISTEIFSLCRSPSAAESAFLASPHGDDLYLLDYLNDAAMRGDAAKADTAFPVGAAIVKQKLTSGVTGEFLIFALGLMIKHEPGFDPAHGDWEFGYWTPTEGFSAGGASATQCGGCHAGSKTDFVFLDQSWRR